MKQVARCSRARRQKGSLLRASPQTLQACLRLLAVSIGLLLVPQIALSAPDKAEDPFVAVENVAHRVWVYLDGRVEFFNDYWGRASVPRKKSIGQSEIRQLLDEFEPSKKC